MQILLHKLEGEVKIPVSYEKLQFFREKVSLSEGDCKSIDPFREFLGEAKDRFADYFYDFFMDIPETLMFLKHYEIPGFLRRA